MIVMIIIAIMTVVALSVVSTCCLMMQCSTHKATDNHGMTHRETTLLYIGQVASQARCCLLLTHTLSYVVLEQSDKMH
jgi:hypothetical protein